jgi:hypothetical protein
VLATAFRPSCDQQCGTLAKKKGPGRKDLMLRIFLPGTEKYFGLQELDLRISFGDSVEKPENLFCLLG